MRGPQPVRWIGSRTVRATGALAPVSIRKDTLGNDRDLLAGPDHRFLLCEWRAELMFGEPEVLASIRHLAGSESIHRQGRSEIELYLILFDNHEIVTANGAFCESYHPGDHGMHWLTDTAREQIFRIFPTLRTELFILWSAGPHVAETPRDTRDPTLNPSEKLHAAAFFGRQGGF